MTTELISTVLATLPPTVAIIAVGLHNNARFNALETRLNDLRDLWRSELRRVEEVLDARLKHLEEIRK